MKTKKVINDIKEWFMKKESFLEYELLVYCQNGYVINGHDISKELTPYSLMVYPSENAPTFTDNRWGICCDVYPYNETRNFEYDDLIVDGYSKNGLVDAIIEAVAKLDL